jgi:hypothetical protein
MVLKKSRFCHPEPVFNVILSLSKDALTGGSCFDRSWFDRSTGSRQAELTMTASRQADLSMAITLFFDFLRVRQC